MGVIHWRKSTQRLFAISLILVVLAAICGVILMSLKNAVNVMPIQEEKSTTDEPDEMKKMEFIRNCKSSNTICDAKCCERVRTAMTLKQDTAGNVTFLCLYFMCTSGTPEQHLLKYKLAMNSPPFVKQETKNPFGHSN